MNESIGGVVNLFMIIFIMVIIALYLAFNVNYQKAFNAKNRIIELYEEYEGECMTNSDCTDEIKAYESSIGYGSVSLSSEKLKKFCEDRGMNYVAPYNYCHKGIAVSSPDSAHEKIFAESKIKCYFDVVTFVEIDIPVINNLLNLRLFQVSGQTKQISVKDNKDKCKKYADDVA